MSIEVARYRFTVEDYHRIGEAGVLREGARVELIAFPDLEVLVDAILG